MLRYIIIGARRSDGVECVLFLDATTRSEAELHANNLGVVVGRSKIEGAAPLPVSAPQTSRRRIRHRTEQERGFARFIAQANALLLLIPGMLMLIATCLGGIAALTELLSQRQLLGGLTVTGTILLIGFAVSVMMMLFSALILLILEVEDHLYCLRIAQQ